jgi:hypothetical protein
MPPAQHNHLLVTAGCCELSTPLSELTQAASYALDAPAQVLHTLCQTTFTKACCSTGTGTWLNTHANNESVAVKALQLALCSHSDGMIHTGRPLQTSKTHTTYAAVTPTAPLNCKSLPLKKLEITTPVGRVPSGTGSPQHQTHDQHTSGMALSERAASSLNKSVSEHAAVNH